MIARAQKAARVWRIVFALVGWSALVMQYGLMVVGQPISEVPLRTLNFFSFFTILTNLLVAVALTTPVIGAGTRVGRWASSEGVRAMVTMYAVVVGVVYHFLLHPYWKPEGLLFFVNILLHYVMPTAFLLDWMLFTPKGRLRWIDAVKWLAFPVIYGLWTLAHGFVAHWWPYGFLNVDDLGVLAAIPFAGILVFFLIVGLMIVAADHVFGRQHRRDLKTQAL